MATSKKSSPSKRKPAKSTAVASKKPDAVVAGDASKPEDTVVPASADTITAADKDTITVQANDTVIASDTVAATGDAASDASVMDTGADNDSIVSEPKDSASTVEESPEPKQEPSAPGVTVTNNTERSIFAPLVLGGALAAVVGFFAAQYGLFSDQGEDPNAALRAELGAQQERIAALETAFDLAPLETRLADLDTRVKALEDRPAVVGPEGLDVDAIASAAAATYSEELEGLRASVESQRSEIQDLLDNAKSVEQATSEAARLASAQTALAKIVSALDSGQPFPQAYAELEALELGEIDPALGAVAADGAATLSMLQAEFPQQARTALAVARRSADGDGQQGLGSFLKRSLGARSVAPREGDDPDAVLSRAEAAINSGDLTTTLTELDTLPEDAQAAIADWREAADAHLNARKAADALAQRLTAD